MYLEDKIDNRVVVAHFCCEIYVINNLKITFLLKINIIDFKRIIVDANKQKLIVYSYWELKINLEIKLRDKICIK